MPFKKVNGSADPYRDPYRDPSSIGNLAISHGFATRAQVLDALHKQEVQRPLGAILVEEGILTPGQLEELLIEQEILRQNMSTKQASKFIKERKKERFREVVDGFHDLAVSLNGMHKA